MSDLEVVLPPSLSSPSSFTVLDDAPISTHKKTFRTGGFQNVSKSPSWRRVRDIRFLAVGTDMISTIGYEGADLSDFIGTLIVSEIDVLVDIRERAQSRRPGFSKSALSSALEQVGIGYLHFRALGDPKEGRDAARSGQMDKFRQVFRSVLESDSAKSALGEILELSEKSNICLLCYERDHRVCHRKMVSDILEKSLGCKSRHLGVIDNEKEKHLERRMLHTREGATA